VNEPGNQEFKANKGDNEIEAENGYIEGYNEDNINPSLMKYFNNLPIHTSNGVF